MISFLRGTIKHKSDKFVILDVNRVGYQIFLPVFILGKTQVGEEAEFFTHLNIREDAMELYGFLNFDELEFFQQLLAVSGIGPRIALGVLSLGKIEDIKEAIAYGNVEFLTKVSGIGRKTAERMIVELRSKMAEAGHKRGSAAFKEGDEEVIDALMGLGYNLPQAREALRQVPESAKGTEERIKEALKRTGRKKL